MNEQLAFDKDGQAVFDCWVREHEKNVKGQMNITDYIDG